MALSTVSVILIEPVAAFEFALAVEVFGLDRTDDGVPPIDFRVCSSTPGVPIRSKDTAAFGIVTPHGLDAVAGSDLVIVSATAYERDVPYPPEALEVIRQAYADKATILSLCSGSFVLGAAGLLDGRRCTTHWRYFEQMAAAYPEAVLDTRSLYVVDGAIITSAGTAAGIDASLYLVRRELGTRIATTIARRMVVPPQRDGGQHQFVETPIPTCTADSLAPLLSWVVDDLTVDHSAVSLAAQAMMSERTFARRFKAETGTTPHRWLTQQRILAARQLLEETDLSIEQIAGRVGFNSAVVLREHFRREIGLAPVDYRRRFVPAR